MTTQLYSTVVNGFSIRATVDQISSFGKAYFSGELLTRISHTLLFEVMALNVVYRMEPGDVFDTIKNLESGVVTGVKPATQFNRLPLKGLWHQHYFSPHFVIKNILLGNGKDGIQNAFETAFDPSISSVVTQQMIDDAVRRIIHDAMDRRSDANQLTGEWVIFTHNAGKRYYLCVSTHSSGDQHIYENILQNCINDFPDLIRAVPEQVGTRAGVSRCRVREEPADAVVLVRRSA